MKPKLRSFSPQNGILILSIIVVGFSACSRDLLFSDELMEMYKGDEMLSISYEVERTEYREYNDPSNYLARNRSVPTIEKQRFDLKLNRAGEVETFTEFLSPSQEFTINESLPSSENEVKFFHYKNGVMRTFDKNRKLISEGESSLLKEGYGSLFNILNEKSSHEETIQAQLTGGMLWSVKPESEDTGSANSQISGRLANSFENPYDNHKDFKVIRNSYTADDGKIYTNELIIHKGSNTIRFMTDYDANNKAVSRVFYTYENIDGKPQLKATHEEHLIQSKYTGSAKQIIISDYDFYKVNLNL